MIVHSHEYDATYFPAMPMIEIKIKRRVEQQPIVLKAIVDSGADATMIPLHFLQQLQARKAQTKWLVGTAGGRYEVDLYTIALQLGEHPPHYIDVVGTEYRDEIIVGRDFLNQYVITLNALASTVSVSL